MTAEKLRIIRHRLKMTQKQLAAELGIHIVTLAGYEGYDPIPKPVELAVRYLHMLEILRERRAK